MGAPNPKYQQFETLPCRWVAVYGQYYGPYVKEVYFIESSVEYWKADLNGWPMFATEQEAWDACAFYTRAKDAIRDRLIAILLESGWAEGGRWDDEWPDNAAHQAYYDFGPEPSDDQLRVAVAEW